MRLQGSRAPLRSRIYRPVHTGSGPGTGPVGMIGSLQEFVTVGGVGTVCASLTQATVELPGAGSVNVGGVIVNVYTQSAVVPVQSEYVHVYVLVPEQTGSAPATGPTGTTIPLHEFTTDGGVGGV